LSTKNPTISSVFSRYFFASSKASSTETLPKTTSPLSGITTERLGKSPL
jgi:hypothetical protein